MIIKTILFDLNKVLVTYENINLNTDYLNLFGITQKDFWNTDRDLFISYVLGKINLNDYLNSIF